MLGPLPGVVNVTATSPQGMSHTWTVRHDEHTYPQTHSRRSGRTVEVPYMGDKAKPDRSELSLLELRGEQFVADRFENISLKDGLLSLDKLPAGDYSLLLKQDPAGRFTLRLTEGERRDGYVLGDYRKLEVRNDRAAADAAGRSDGRRWSACICRTSRRWRASTCWPRASSRPFPRMAILASILPAGAVLAARRRGPSRNTSPGAISATNIATSSIASSPENIRATCSSGRAYC